MGAFALFVTVLWFSGSPCDVRVIHAGYTNSPANKDQYAVFVLTNVGSGNVTVWPDFIVESDDSPPRRWRGEFAQMSGITPAGKAREFVQAPLSSARWRLAVLCSPDGFRTDLGEHLGTKQKGWTRALLRDWLHVVPVCRVSTDWIEP
jgi:hypothetical protein